MKFKMIPYREDEYVVPLRLPMRSGIGEQEGITEYELHAQVIGSSTFKNWLFPVGMGNRAEHIYNDNPSAREEGFGGRTMEFPLAEGGTYEATGPWHSNAYALLRATGIDLRSEHYTQGCVALNRRQVRQDNLPNSEQSFGYVLISDDEPVLGMSSRIKCIAKLLSQHIDIPVYYYLDGSSGILGTTLHDSWLRDEYDLRNFSPPNDKLIELLPSDSLEVLTYLEFIEDSQFDIEELEENPDGSLRHFHKSER